MEATKDPLYDLSVPLSQLGLTDEPAPAYGVSYLATPATPTPTGDPLELLRRAVRGFAPAAKLQAYVLLNEDGIAPATYSYHVKLYGPDVRDAVKLQAATIEELVVSGKRAWAKERRRTDVFRLVEDCQRIVGGCLDEDFEEALRYEMEGCSVSDFPIRAAKWRSKAVAYTQQQAA